MSNKCPICESELSTPDVPFMSRMAGIHGKAYSCLRCGDYQLESFAGAQLNARLDGDKKKIAVLSHWIRSRYERRDTRGSQVEEPINLTDDLVRDIIRNPLPSIAEQKDKLVLWLGDNSRPGEHVRIYPVTHQSIVGAMTPEGFLLVLHYLAEKGLLAGMWPSVSNGETKTSLSVPGWQYYEELRRGATDSHRAFMAMKYGDEQLDKLFEDVLRPAVKQTGFDLSRLDGPDQPAGLIDDALRVAIRTSRFLVADLTHENRGAYWEAGYAEGLGRPVIYTCEEKKFGELQTHFDTNHHLTILWNSDEPQKAAKKLKNTIRATLPVEAKLTDD